MNKLNKLILAFCIVVSMFPSFTFANGSLKNDSKLIDEVSNQEQKTIYINFPSDASEIVLSSVKVNGGMSIVSKEVVTSNGVRQLKLEIRGKKVTIPSKTVKGYSTGDTRDYFTANPGNAVCRYADGLMWQVNTRTIPDFGVDLIDYRGSGNAPIELPVGIIREVMTYSSPELNISAIYFRDDNGGIIQRSAIKPDSLRIEKNSSDVTNMRVSGTSRGGSIVLPKDYDPKNPKIGVNYKFSSTYIPLMKTITPNDSKFLTGHAGCWMYPANYEYIVTADTIPYDEYQYKGTVNFDYIPLETPTIKGKLTADPKSVKYVGNDVQVKLTLEGKVENIEKPGVLKEYVLNVRLKEGTMISPVNDTITANGKTTVKRDYYYTIPRSKLSSSSVQDFTQEFVGRVEAFCSSGSYIDCSKLNSGPLYDSTYVYKDVPTPSLKGTLTADPISAKYVGDDIQVKLTLEGEVINIERPEVLNKYVLNVRLEDGTMISPTNDTIIANGNTKVKREYNYTIPKSKLSNTSILDYTEKFAGRVIAYCDTGTNIDCSHLNSGLLEASTYVYKNIPTPTPSNAPTPTPTTQPQKLPPVAIIDSLSQVKLGDTIAFSGLDSYDSDGTIEGYRWQLPDAKDADVELDTYDINSGVVTAWYDTLGLKKAKLYVKDNDGMLGATYHTLTVVTPTVEARIQQSGTLKENRKVTFTDVSDSPTRYPVDTSKTKWSIEPVTDGISSSSIKYSGSLNGKQTFDVLFKQAGEYVVTLTVFNTAGYTDTTKRVFTVKPDEAPIVDFEFQQKIYRDPADGNMATFELRDKSYSMDGDTIAKRTWYVTYDANNDGVFDEAKVTFNTGNNEVVTYRANKVGRYAFYLQAQEEFGQPTIAAFVTADDRRLTQSWVGTDKKPNNVGEVLNLAPTVDFELKESKKKVDVIVDVGNTSYTEDQIRSMVNEQLRPTLNENGLDYTIHIEKSSEGVTKQYYTKYITNKEQELWEYDVLSGAKRLVRKVETDSISRAIYDPTNEVIIVSASVPKYVNTGSENYIYIVPIDANQPIYRLNNTTNTSNFILTSDGYLIVYRGGSNKYIVAGKMSDIIDGTQRSLKVRSTTQSSVDPRVMMAFQDGHVYTSHTEFQYRDIHSDYHLVDSFRMYSNVGQYYYMESTSRTALPSPSNINVLPQTDRIIQMPTTKEYIVTKLRWRPNTDAYVIDGFDTVIYNMETNQQRIFKEAPPDSHQVSTIKKPHFYSLGGNELLFKDYDEKTYYYPDYLNPNERVLLSDKAIYPRGNIGPYIFHFGQGNSSSGGLNSSEIKMLNIYTGEEVTIDSRYVRLASYPTWYHSPMKRYMTDILDEVPLRSDADKYYIRIDDQQIPHLEDSRNVAKTVKAFQDNNIEFLTIGNAASQATTSRVQSTLSNGQVFDINQIQTSLQKISKYIAERKEVDLHVLVAQSGQSDSAMKASVQQLVTDLKAYNIYVTPYFHYGTSSSKLQEMYDKIKWNEEKNQYVLFLQTASMSELSDPAYLEGAALTLLTNYAHYFQIGSSINRSIAESLIQLNEQKGRFYVGTSYSTYYNGMKQVIIDTALQSPKRIKDVLVLEYDPVTNEYSAEIDVNLFYDDAEGDRKRAERFKTTHDPTVYENHTGVMDGTGQYMNTLTTRFTKVGLYEMTMQAQDEPLADSRFSNYWMWSKDSLSMLRLYVHREPVAKFKAIVQPNKSVSITDYSYDLDRYSRLNQGIVEWEWKWKKITDLEWSTGQLTTVDGVSDYFISLRVKDLDGAWSKESIQLIAKTGENQPPVALFSITPASVSHRANAMISDLSYDPDGDALIKREWIATKDGKTIWFGTTQPTKQGLQNEATANGISHLGSYQVQLRVTDVHGALSDWHTEWMEVVNYPPVANFEDVPETYRDSLNTLVNTTVEPDPDDDSVSYTWLLLYKNNTYELGGSKNPSFKIKNLGLGKSAVGEWQIRLVASDPYGASSMLTKTFNVINRPPIATISSAPTSGYVDESYSFTSADTDPDSEDVSSLQSFWRFTSPSGKVQTFYSKNVTNISFDEKGTHKIEHWAEDQFGAVSEVVTATINILNKLPIADFTRNPITTYRGVDIDFQSLGTDYDGWIEGYRYELMRTENTPLTISTEANFTRSFSSIGTFDIRHTVTDNDGASDFITKKIYIVNRPPQAQVTVPSGSSAATATQFNTLTPMIRWTMSDADGDQQVQYQLQLKSENGTFLRTTAIMTTSNQQYILPNGWVSQGQIYRVTVRVFDGYDWSNYAQDRYFYVQLNQPPEAGFTYSPTLLYEGDTLNINHNVSDPDHDTLSVRYEVTAPNGVKSYYPSVGTSYTLTSSQYNRSAFLIQAMHPGKYTITQTVNDGQAPTATYTQSINVAPLSIMGQVSHTELWEGYRQTYNASLPTSSNKHWEAHQFYSGERFMLTADTTLSHNATTETDTYAVTVIATLNTTGSTVHLSYEGNNRWEGSMWEAGFNELAKGKHNIVFQATYSNGVIKQQMVEIEIIGNASYWVQVQRWK